VAIAIPSNERVALAHTWHDHSWLRDRFSRADAGRISTWAGDTVGTYVLPDALLLSLAAFACRTCRLPGGRHADLSSCPSDCRRRRSVLLSGRWTCSICGRRIDPAHKSNSREAGTIDHVLPQSRGGDNGRSNLRAAHMICNAQRGAPILTPDGEVYPRSAERCALGMDAPEDEVRGLAAAMPDPDRSVMLLFLEAKGVSAIARTLGMSYDAVAAIVGRRRESLTASLLQAGHEPRDDTSYGVRAYIEIVRDKCLSR
jgi:hypothetical protein